MEENVKEETMYKSEKLDEIENKVEELEKKLDRGRMLSWRTFKDDSMRWSLKAGWRR